MKKNIKTIKFKIDENDIPYLKIGEEIEMNEFFNEKTESKYYGMTSPQDINYILTKYFKDTDREEFIILNLNTKNEIININPVSVGSLNSSIVHPREVFKTAIMSNSASIILAHNHPSKNPEPSREDIIITRRLLDAGEILGIKILDHVIHGTEFRFYSLKENNDM